MTGRDQIGPRWTAKRVDRQTFLRVAAAATVSAVVAGCLAGTAFASGAHPATGQQAAFADNSVEVTFMHI